MTGLGLSDGPVAKNLPYNAGHGGSIVVRSEEASVTGTRRCTFPDRVAMWWALSTGGIRGEGLVISNFAS